MEQTQRDQTIIRTSIIGISVNAALAAAKVIIGQITGSVAISLDGVNNLTDAGSSVITMISTKLASRPADREHPYGYGRTEYLSTLVIGVIILYAGITSVSESVQKIISGGDPSYSALSLWILTGAVIVKAGLGLYTMSQGKKADSGSLSASGRDALNDAVMSASVIAAALIFLATGVSLEAWVGLVIAVFILKSGFDILKETLSQIIGERMDSEISSEVLETIRSVPGIRGAYDLFFHDYGPNRKIASVHIEVPDTFTADEIDAASRQIEKAVYQKTGVLLSAVGVYAKNTGSSEEARIEQQIRQLLNKYPYILQMHGFYVNRNAKQLRFDIVIDFAAKNRHEEYAEILKETQQTFPDYQVAITLDSDVAG